MKKLARTKEKLKIEYSNDTRRLKDVLRAAILVTDLTERELGRRSWGGGRGWTGPR